MLQLCVCEQVVLKTFGQTELEEMFVVDSPTRCDFQTTVLLKMSIKTHFSIKTLNFAASVQVITFR